MAGAFITNLLFVLLIVLIAVAIAFYFLYDWAMGQTRREVASIGDVCGSMEIDGQWYVIKRERE
jgi:hypothetical protein